jgi:tripartite-type tricarboxylate transporter receptor subunit TctC
MRHLIFLSLLAAAPAVAQQAPPAHSFAFIVGANRGGAQQQDLRYAEEDARRLAELVTSIGHFRPATCAC